MQAGRAAARTGVASVGVCDPGRRVASSRYSNEPGSLGLELKGESEIASTGLAAWKGVMHALFLSLLGFATLPGSALGAVPRLWVEIESEAPRELRAALEAEGLDVTGVDPVAERVGVIVDDAGLEGLERRGFQPIVRARSQPYREVAAGAGLGPDLGYRDRAEVEADLLTLAETYPELAERVDLNARLGLPTTAEGNRVYALRISDHIERDEDEPALGFIGLHHARELNTIEAAFDTAEELLAGYGTDPALTDWVDAYEIWVVPVVNPDGLDTVWNVDRWWRKNRRRNDDGSFGVDLNRNYPFLWGECGNVSGFPSSDVYRGPSPGSEPEVQVLMALAEAERFLALLSYHSSGREILYPYACATMAEERKIGAGRTRYQSATGYGSRFASASGEDFEWHYNQANTMAYLIEMGTSFQPGIAETRAEVENYIRPGWQLVLGAISKAPVVAGHVTDSKTGAPLEAEITVDEIAFVEGERMASEATFGRYHVVLLPGRYTLRFSAPGYVSQTRKFVNRGGGWKLLDVALVPDA